MLIIKEMEYKSFNNRGGNQMRKKKFILTFFSLMFFLVSLSVVVYADVIVITNNSVTENLDLAEIKKIYLGKKKFWNNDQIITLFVSKNTETQNEFVTKYLDKSINQFTNYWKRILFTGQGMMPNEVSDQDVVELVKRTEGAIGYVPADLNTDGVKVNRLEQDKN